MITMTRKKPSKCMCCDKHITTSEPANKLKLNKYRCLPCNRSKRERRVDDAINKENKRLLLGVLLLLIINYVLWGK